MLQGEAEGIYEIPAQRCALVSLLNAVQDHSAETAGKAAFINMVESVSPSFSPLAQISKTSPPHPPIIINKYRRDFVQGCPAQSMSRLKDRRPNTDEPPVV